VEKEARLYLGKKGRTNSPSSAQAVMGRKALTLVIQGGGRGKKMGRKRKLRSNLKERRKSPSGSGSTLPKKAFNKEREGGLTVSDEENRDGKRKGKGLPGVGVLSSERGGPQMGRLHSIE